MIRLPPRSTLPVTLVPYPTLFRAEGVQQRHVAEIEEEQDEHRGEAAVPLPPGAPHRPTPQRAGRQRKESEAGTDRRGGAGRQIRQRMAPDQGNGAGHGDGHVDEEGHPRRSEENTSELQSLMRSPYAVLC